MAVALSREDLASLKRFETCVVADAIETFDVRLRNEGFADNSIRRLTDGSAPIVGYAATLRIRCASPPMVGHAYVDRTDWWNHILTIPEPRIVVIQDMDETPGIGTFVDELHAHVLKALGCVGAITNGAVRNVPEVEAVGFQLFANGVAVSHAYEHIVDFGGSVEIGGLVINPGDLLHADLHGVLSVPTELAPRIPAVAAKLLERSRELKNLCQSETFSFDRLREAVKDVFP